MEPYRDTPPVPDWYADGTVPPWMMPQEVTERPEWLDLRPPYRDGSKMEHWWSVVMMPFRALALGFLFITFRWWYSAIALGTVLLFILVFFLR